MLQAVLLALAPAAATLPTPSSASAGPPAICFPLDIGEARSLPWVGEDAFGIDPSYGQERLVADVIAALSGSDEALVHAETLRRAVIYLTEGAPKGQAAAVRMRRLELLQALQARVLDFELQAARGLVDAHARALAWLDVGYALGAFDQIGAERFAPPLPTLKRARELAPQDGGVALAAWLAAWTRDAAEAEQSELLAAAVRLADDPKGPVRTNLMAIAGHFLGVETYEQLAAKVAASGPRGG